VESARLADMMYRAIRPRITDMRRRGTVSAAAVLGADFVSKYSHEQLRQTEDNLKQRLFEDTFSASLQSLLRYEDRNTMRFSIEGRVPFLDATLLRTLWSTDTEAIIGNGWNKRALREATADLIPPPVRLRRDKIGFTTPEVAWMHRIGHDVRSVFE